MRSSSEPLSVSLSRHIESRRNVAPRTDGSVHFVLPDDLTTVFRYVTTPDSGLDGCSTQGGYNTGRNAQPRL